MGEKEFQRPLLPFPTEAVVGEDEGGQAHENVDDPRKVGQRKNLGKGIVIELLLVDLRGDSPDQGMKGQGGRGGGDNVVNPVEMGVLLHVSLDLPLPSGVLLPSPEGIVA